MNNFPTVLKLGGLLQNVMLFIMTTSSLNYDLYFFSPALNFLGTSGIERIGHGEQLRTLMNFLDSNFTIDKYASNFKFNETESPHRFLQRFLENLELQNSIPEEVRASIAVLKPDILQGEEENEFPYGNVKPIPIYIFSRISTFLAELDYGLRKIYKDDNFDSVEAIMKFLIEDFQPDIHGQGLNLNEGSVLDVVAACGFGFTAENKGKDTRLFLTDGTQASTKNKEFFELLLPNVPKRVGLAIEIIIPYL
ncbi:hypothetical protein C0J52_09034 [Blattella germanica]|nr:hypothetical protein C0J52_09034 [Blattella germanica]